MYVVLLNYVAPLEEVDVVLPEHSAWLAEQYEAGYFLASGRRRPRVGTVILARAMPRGKLDAILASDPFVGRRLVRHEVIEFQATRTAPPLVAYAEPVE